jgi:glucokinase
MRLGIDIGGTTVKIGAVTSDGEVLARIDQPFIRDKPFPALLADLVEACRNLERQTGRGAQVAGLCAPGFIDPASGALADGGANVPALRDQPLARLITAQLGIPSRFENDGVAAAIGEIRFGAGRRFHRVLTLTLGTGVGGCIAIDEKVVRGSRGEPPEIGAMILEDVGASQGAVRPGSLESYACAAGFLAAYGEAGGISLGVDVKDLFVLARSDSTASTAIDAVARRIAQAIGSLINALALDGCVIGGGISHAGDDLIARIDRHLPTFTWPLLLKNFSLVRAARGNEAGLIGAATLAAEALLSADDLSIG